MEMRKKSSLRDTMFWTDFNLLHLFLSSLLHVHELPLDNQEDDNEVLKFSEQE